MKKILTFALISFVAFNSSHAMRLDSRDLKNGKSMPISHVFNDFGCNGGDISPHLHWADFPENTKSFAVTTFDPDAPTESGWWHWTMFNIPVTVTELQRGDGEEKKTVLPFGSVQLRNDFNITGYSGACPPVGDKHHYIFTVYALDVEKINLSSDTPPAMANFYIRKHAIAKAKITVTYKRN